MADCTESLPEFLHPEEGMVQRQVNILTQSLNDAPTFGKAGTALETECILAGRLEQRFQHGRYPPVLLNGGQPGFVDKVPGYCPLQVDGLAFHRQLAGRTGSNNRYRPSVPGWTAAMHSKADFLSTWQRNRPFSWKTAPPRQTECVERGFRVKGAENKHRKAQSFLIFRKISYLCPYGKSAV